MSQHLWWTLMAHLLLAASTGGDEKVNIKIVEAPALSRFPVMPSSSESRLTLRVKPANLTGPPHLLQLAGKCFETKESGYTYSVCPFQNVTQKEDRSSWNSFHGVLGVWQEWLIEDDIFRGMHFMMGDRCSSDDRAAKVVFNCSTITRLHNVSEPHTCKYTIWMDTPLACFKGAMQVYHVLSPDQLNRWDQLEQEYYGGEITRQGLEKKRKQLFIEAGHLRDPKEMKALEQEEQHSDNEKPLFEATSPYATIHQLQQCQQRTTELETQLRELKESVRSLLSDHPDLAPRFNLEDGDVGQAAADPAAPVPAGGVGHREAEGGVENSRPTYEQLDVTTHEDEGEGVAGNGLHGNQKQVEESHKLDGDINPLGQEEPVRLVKGVPQESEGLRERESFDQEGGKRDVLLAKLLEEDSINELLEKHQG